MSEYVLVNHNPRTHASHIDQTYPPPHPQAANQLRARSEDLHICGSGGAVACPQATPAWPQYPAAPWPSAHQPAEEAYYEKTPDASGQVVATLGDRIAAG